ncbi:hypothetical protein RFI_04255, partial [Reticulomyxa filosa]
DKVVEDGEIVYVMDLIDLHNCTIRRDKLTMDNIECALVSKEIWSCMVYLYNKLQRYRGMNSSLKKYIQNCNDSQTIPEYPMASDVVLGEGDTLWSPVLEQYGQQQQQGSSDPQMNLNAINLQNTASNDTLATLRTITVDWSSNWHGPKSNTRMTTTTTATTTTTGDNGLLLNNVNSSTSKSVSIANQPLSLMLTTSCYPLYRDATMPSVAGPHHRKHPTSYCSMTPHRLSVAGDDLSSNHNSRKPPKISIQTTTIIEEPMSMLSRRRNIERANE